MRIAPIERLSPDPKRVAFYARVSTTRQAEADLSIPDQMRQAETWCQRLGHQLVKQYVESGASGTDENRPVFVEMINHAKSLPRPFDLILVHSFSRFARDNFAHAIAKRQLNRAGIGLQSITQPLNADPTGEMVESVLVAFDAYQSRENGKHTSRAMKENARQGFWNGSTAPFGYIAIDAERRGDKVKRVLSIQDDEARIVHRIYDLYLGVETLQYGVKAIVSKLNGEGISFRGKPFMISTVYRILTSETYTGTFWFNVYDTKTKQVRPRSEWVRMETPLLISREVFNAVQEQLASRAPKKRAPRLVNSPTLLTGIATCAHCGAGMTLRTGKNYRYYACAGRAQKGPTRCGGCAVSMPKVDNAVLSALRDDIFMPDKLTELVSGYLAQARDEAQKQRSQLSELKTELTETEGAIKRLLGMVEKGLMEVDDPALAERLRNLKTKRAELQRQVDGGSANNPAQRNILTEAKVVRTAEAVRGALQDASPERRKAYLKLFVDKVVISKEEICISGPKCALALAASRGLPDTTDGVITFVRGWRPRRDSNPRPQD